MNERDSFRLIPWEYVETAGDALVAFLAAAVLLLGTSPDFIQWWRAL